AADLRPVLRDGPARHVHVFGWWRGLRRFGEDTGGSAGREDVAGVVLLNVPATDAAIFLGELDLEWQPRPNRALFHDRHASRTDVIVPFVRASAGVADEDEVATVDGEAASGRERSETNGHTADVTATTPVAVRARTGEPNAGDEGAGRGADGT